MNKLLMKRISFSLLAVLVTLLITFTHAVAQEVPFYWDYINVNIDVHKAISFAPFGPKGAVNKIVKIPIKGINIKVIHPL